MKKTLFCLSVGVICSAMAFAQDTTTTGQSTTAPAQSTTVTAVDSTSNGTPIQGCLSGSDGSYMLTQDGTSKIYKLVGMDSQLKKHVGHEVAVTGAASGTTGSASGSASDQGQVQPSSGGASGDSLQVTNVKMVSSTCSTSANGTQSPK